MSKNKNGLPQYVFVSTIDEFIEGDASLRRYGITFDDNIDVECANFIVEIVVQLNMLHDYNFFKQMVLRNSRLSNQIYQKILYTAICVRIPQYMSS